VVQSPVHPTPGSPTATDDTTHRDVRHTWGVELFKEFGFEAAHFLPNVPDGHKCARMHGHSFRVRVSVEGPVDPTLGWVTDFGDVSAVVSPVIAELDHRCLNDIDGLDNPTSEVVARWLWDRLASVVVGLAAIELRETCTSGVIYRGR
jgi:6-pyruvoyltetrahydropterin/6-carboxytetrahydropterin synthase